MTERSRPRESRTFATHLALASALFGALAMSSVGVLLFGRWAIRLELASSTTQSALAASRRLLALHESFWPVAAVSLVALAASAYWLGGKLTGPLKRFEEAFRAVAAGNVPPPVRARRTDFIARELAALNAMLGALRDRQVRQAEALAELRGTLDQLADRAQRHRDVEAGELVASALAQADKLAGAGDGGA